MMTCIAELLHVDVALLSAVETIDPLVVGGVLDLPAQLADRRAGPRARGRRDALARAFVTDGELGQALALVLRLVVVREITQRGLAAAEADANLQVAPVAGRDAADAAVGELVDFGRGLPRGPGLVGLGRVARAGLD